jgi:hypothetical protein
MPMRMISRAGAGRDHLHINHVRALSRSVRATQITWFGRNPDNQADGQVVDQIESSLLLPRRWRATAVPARTSPPAERLPPGRRCAQSHEHSPSGRRWTPVHRGNPRGCLADEMTSAIPSPRARQRAECLVLDGPLPSRNPAEVRASGSARVSQEQDKSQKVTPEPTNARQHPGSPGCAGRADRTLASDHGAEVVHDQTL